MSVSNFSLRRAAGNTLAVFVMAAAVLAPPALAAAPKQKTYASAEAASAALLEAARSGKSATFQAVFGPVAKRLGSGDPVLAKIERERFIAAYNEKHAVRREGDSRATLVLGNDEWPFPVPLVKVGKHWRFDSAAGEEEIINRRVGRNELYAIQVLMALVDAQRDYASVDRNGDGVREYAPKFASSPDKHDGLYWPTAAGEPASPLGPLVASAVGEGYVPVGNKPQPYWGYYYRILAEQGGAAKGGAYSYIADDRMIGGFAVVAFPAEYGFSGVKSFIVNHEGVVFEKDLGPESAKQVLGMTQFNPDSGWVEARSLSLMH
ncbi:MAG: DUF2950 domain-containing protein [Rhodocyclaceae bacterium]